MSSLDADQLKLFTGRANPELAQKICAYLQIPLGQGRTELFADGELIVKVEEDVRGRDCYVVQPTSHPVNAHLMERTGNPAARFMHCLPAYHDLGTAIGREIHAEFGLTALEVTDDVFEGPSSVVFDQAENRLHSIKAVLVATLGG